MLNNTEVHVNELIPLALKLRPFQLCVADGKIEYLKWLEWAQGPDYNDL